jgi:hypothetical protein
VAGGREAGGSPSRARFRFDVEGGGVGGEEIGELEGMPVVVGRPRNVHTASFHRRERPICPVQKELNVNRVVLDVDGASIDHRSWKSTTNAGVNTPRALDERYACAVNVRVLEPVAVEVPL